jgi:anti-sigma factor RsiW
MKTRFDELLPFYVNGTLSDADRSWVDSYLREHPQAGAELNWCQNVQTRLREDLPPVSSEVGLERALRRIRSEGPAPQAARQAAGALAGRTAARLLRDAGATTDAAARIRRCDGGGGAANAGHRPDGR